MTELAAFTDQQLREEIERRHLLVDAWANDPADGYGVTDDTRPCTASGTFTNGPFVWRSDVTWTVAACDVCGEIAAGYAYQASKGYQNFCETHLPTLSAEWNYVASNHGGERFYKRGGRS